MACSFIIHSMRLLELKMIKMQREHWALLSFWFISRIRKLITGSSVEVELAMCQDCFSSRSIRYVQLITCVIQVIKQFMKHSGCKHTDNFLHIFDGQNFLFLLVL
jgi:hypothetical protein